MNRIAEVCAELGAYRIMIKVDEIVDNYRERTLAEIEVALWRLLRELQTSPNVIIREARRDHNIH